MNSLMPDKKLVKKPFPFEQCPKAFGQRSNLIEHKRTHADEKHFLSDQYPKALIQKGDLIRHKRIHTGEKPYPCDQCSKAFK